MELEKMNPKAFSVSDDELKVAILNGIKNWEGEGYEDNLKEYHSEVHFGLETYSYRLTAEMKDDELIFDTSTCIVKRVR